MERFTNWLGKVAIFLLIAGGSTAIGQQISGGGGGCANNCSFTGVTTFGAGSAGAPSLVLPGDTTSGWYQRATERWTLSLTGNQNALEFGGGGSPYQSMNSGFRVGWTASSAAAAMDSGIARNAAGVTEVHSGNAGVYAELKLRSIINGGTVPGISGCSAGTQVGGGTVGTYASGTTGVCTVTLTFAFTAPTGWSCSASNQTTANLIRQTGFTTTTAVIAGTTVSGDVISFGCMAY